MISGDDFYDIAVLTANDMQELLLRIVPQYQTRRIGVIIRALLYDFSDSDRVQDIAPFDAS